jgi:hypothetical protein
MRSSLHNNSRRKEVAYEPEGSAKARLRVMRPVGRVPCCCREEVCSLAIAIHLLALLVLVSLLLLLLLLLVLWALVLRLLLVASVHSTVTDPA